MDKSQISLFFRFILGLGKFISRGALLQTFTKINERGARDTKGARVTPFLAEVNENVLISYWKQHQILSHFSVNSSFVSVNPFQGRAAPDLCQNSGIVRV